MFIASEDNPVRIRVRGIDWWELDLYPVICADFLNDHPFSADDLWVVRAGNVDLHLEIAQLLKNQ